MSITKKSKVTIVFMGILFFILDLCSRSFPQFIEAYYSRSIGKAIQELLSNLTGLVPFSIGEILVIILFLGIVYVIVYLIISIFKGYTNRALLNISAVISIIYSLFIFLWALNYNRAPLAQTLGLKLKTYSVEDLSALCVKLQMEAIDLRSKLEENSSGVLVINAGYKDIFLRSSKAFEKVYKSYPFLKGKYGTPKPIGLSGPLSYTGITGIFIPFTGEANINTKPEDFTLPATVIHEMAHVRGFAKEAEANFISYIVCSKSPYLDFKYSGIMLGYCYSINKLRTVDIDKYNTLVMQLSPAVKRDLIAEYDFWAKYSGSANKIAETINDKYLKANGEKSGVQSYGEMVDLLIAMEIKKG